LFKHSVTRVTVLSLALGLGLGTAALADGPPNKKAMSAARKPAPAVKKTPVATVRSDPGKALVERACQSCHDLGTVTQARHTAKQWPGVVVRMRANGADLTDAELKQVQDYLVKTYATTP
jgi:cytochrome c2